MAVLAGIRGTGNFGTDERPKNFREMILFRNPNGNAPIFALTSKMNKRTVDDPEFHWWCERNDVMRFRASGGVANTAINAEVTVDFDSADSAVASSSGTVGGSYSDPRHLVVGDLLMQEAGYDSDADAAHRIWEVTSAAVGDTPPNYATKLTLRTGHSTAANNDIADNDLFLKIGNVFEEGSRAPLSATRLPDKYFNYTQIFKTTYKVTGTADKTHFRTGGAVQQDKKRKSFDHARDIETSLLFGRRLELNGNSGQPKRMMNGIIGQIPAGNKTDMANTGTLNTLLDAVSKVFDWESSAGDTRMVFCGNGALNGFNKTITGLGLSSSQSSLDRVQYKADESVYGTRFMRYRIPQGDLFLKVHPLMNRIAQLNNSFLILDQSALKYVCLRGRDTKFKDNVQENDEDAMRGMWMTECSTQLDHGGVTCGLINNLHTLAT